MHVVRLHATFSVHAQDTHYRRSTELSGGRWRTDCMPATRPTPSARTRCHPATRAFVVELCGHVRCSTASPMLCHGSPSRTWAATSTSTGGCRGEGWPVMQCWLTRHARGGPPTAV